MVISERDTPVVRLSQAQNGVRKRLDILVLVASLEQRAYCTCFVYITGLC